MGLMELVWTPTRSAWVLRAAAPWALVACFPLAAGVLALFEDSSDFLVWIGVAVLIVLGGMVRVAFWWRVLGHRSIGFDEGALIVPRPWPLSSKDVVRVPISEISAIEILQGARYPEWQTPAFLPAINVHRRGATPILGPPLLAVTSSEVQSFVSSVSGWAEERHIEWGVGRRLLF